jgi:hypothetical protein
MSQSKGDKLVVPADQPLVPSEFALISKVTEIFLESLGIADGVSLISIRSLPVVHKSQLLADIYVEEAKQARGVQDVEGDAVMPARLVKKHSFFEGPETVNHS